jgi:hypothetical protein
MSEPTVPNRITRKRSLSRRRFLLGVGAVSTVATAAVCGSASLVALLLGSELKSRREQPTATPNPPTATSRPEPPRPEIVSRDEWGALAPNHEAVNEPGFYSEANPEGWLIYESELQDIYNTVIIHHSAFYEDTDLRTMEAIQRLHRADRGWADVAYHFVVGRTGVIYEGRDWAVRGTHVDSYNTGTLGICLMGNFVEQQPTDAQMASVRRLLLWVTYRLQISHIAAHRTFNAQTQCPGDNLMNRLPELAAVADLNIGTDGYVPLAEAIECTCCACNSD